MRGDEKANLVEVDGIAHEKDGEENAKELPRGGDGGEDERGEVAHGVEDEELSDGGTDAKLDRQPETARVRQEEGDAGNQLTSQQGRDERDAHSVHVQHLLETERRGLEPRDDDVLLHSADAVHAEGEEEQDEAEGAVGGGGGLLGLGVELEH
jgi:hypothetical protein